MYIVLVTSKNEKMLKALLPDLKKEYPNILFSVYEMNLRGYQIRLEGLADEVGPQKFVNKFCKEYIKNNKEENK